jgi:hypothetical protein
MSVTLCLRVSFCPSVTLCATTAHAYLASYADTPFSPLFLNNARTHTRTQMSSSSSQQPFDTSLGVGAKAFIGQRPLLAKGQFGQ